MFNLSIPDRIGPNLCDLRVFVQVLAPAQYGRLAPLTVVLHINRRCAEGKSVRAWEEQRLSHRRRSPTRQTCSKTNSLFSAWSNTALSSGPLSSFGMSTMPTVISRLTYTALRPVSSWVRNTGWMHSPNASVPLLSPFRVDP